MYDISLLITCTLQRIMYHWAIHTYDNVSVITYILQFIIYHQALYRMTMYDVSLLVIITRFICIMLNNLFSWNIRVLLFNYCNVGHIIALLHSIYYNSVWYIFPHNIQQYMTHHDLLHTYNNITHYKQMTMHYPKDL